MPFKAGDLFLARLPDGSTVEHLCIVLTSEDSTEFQSTVFVVPVMTPTSKSDRTTMLPVSACPEFLKYESCIVYASLVEKEPEHLLPLIVRHFAPIGDDQLRRVVNGAFASPLTPRGLRIRLRERR